MSCDEEILEKIVNSVTLRVVEILMLILSTISIPVLFHMFHRCKNTQLFHFNIRLISAFHCLCLMIHCIARVFQHGADLFLYFSDIPICEKVPSVKRCLATRIPYIFGLFCASYSTVFMVLERTIATKNYKKYENRHKTLGYCFIFGQIFMGTTTTIAIFYKFDFNQGQEFCSGSQSSDPAYMIIPESVAILSNFIAFFQFGKLMRINTKIRVGSSENNLSQKYQIEENLNVVRILRAFTKCDFVFILIYFTMGIPFHLVGKHLDHADYYALFEVIYFVPIYSLIMPAYIYQFSKKQRVERINRVEQKIQVSEDAYFQFIHKQWT
ncbi:Serpentine Receptor, class AB (Class A-like) [Caenorhabditis elegans]|uniref:Serpentine Receptor, class AB (Class A-like) n=2 Tax=Caenorhabditis elegans TaxID=6239 RepID=O17010_CAEEL|nr:Serpentine Receptor, class AB (Class A-like) [Caenorhabditis elegans]CCD71086.1 Serpentine Receptor, class AB (Class A-like) [Caenorhabditis elegans]|eukprot:NP_503325.2 Serpentine Receptor, class AB (class A-like) [Caenorhabditis elegans]